MAVLYALLGNTAAVRTRKFDDLTGRYDSELAEKKILRLTYHLLGATSLEQLRTNIGSADVTLSNEVLTGIEAIHREIPDPCP